MMPARNLLFFAIPFLFLILSFLFTPNLAHAADASLKDRWNALPQASYTTDNLMCDLLAKLAGYCPYGETAVRRVDENNNVELSLHQGSPGQGAIGGLTTYIAALYKPPTSSVQYLADVGKGFGLISPAYAQSVGGSGAGIIQPVRTLWQVIRNISYLAFIFVFITIGFMIMFRQKINPQTVISAQNALPGLVVGLILVTFSYFIAALIVDMAFLGTRLVAEVFIQTNQPNWFGEPNPNAANFSLANANRIRQQASDSSAFGLLGSSLGVVWSTVGDTSGGLYRTIGSEFTTLAPITAVAGTVIGGVIGSIIPGAGTLIGAAVGGTVGAAALPGIISLLIPLVLVIVLIIQFFRLLMKLIEAYISILIATIIGPFTILVSSIPGKGGGVGGWLKSLLGNALVFPSVFAAFLFAGLILATPSNAWSANPPLLGNLDTELLKVIIAYGILVGLPAIPDAVKNAFGVKGGPAIAAEALGGVAAGWGAANTFGPGAGRAGVRAVFRGVLERAPDGSRRAQLGQALRDHPEWMQRPPRR